MKPDADPAGCRLPVKVDAHTSSTVTVRSYQPLSSRICGTFGSSTRSEIVNVPACAGRQA
jgi:hypothetical protein